MDRTDLRFHVVPVGPDFQPPTQNFRAPDHNADYGIEQDFLATLQTHYQDAGASRAHWHYLPIFWNRYYINNAWGADGLDELQAELDRTITNGARTFTVSEYDVVDMQGFLDLHGMTVFCGSRRSDNGCVDVPLLCSRHPQPGYAPPKKYDASFVGNLETWGVRSQMAEALAGRDNVHLEHGNRGTEFFVQLMLASRVALAPRGHGGQSYRFYEAMQLGVPPLLIGDIDTRPFQSWLPWETCSFYLEDPREVASYLDRILAEHDLALMGDNAKLVYDNGLAYGNWPMGVFETLAQRT